MGSAEHPGDVARRVFDPFEGLLVEAVRVALEGIESEIPLKFSGEFG